MLAAFGAAAPVRAADNPVVTIAQGALKGTSADGIEAFKAIPFAQAPVGVLRWRPPAPAPAWQGVRDATAAGPVCIQGYKTASTSVQSEDCLFVNVWRPAGTAPGAKLPVMVWIHGGAWLVGAGSLPVYDGSELARRGVIVVTLNHRLDLLGFFAHPALTAEDPSGRLGNYGIMDQIAALEWVQSNIAALGGDPGNVTIFGESTGGISVNVLMTVPAARGLFAKGIAQSPGGRSEPLPIRGSGRRTAEGDGEAFAKTLGVTGTGPDALSALRALPAEMFARGFYPGFNDEIRSGDMGPIRDGMMIKESTMAAFTAGREAKIPYIIGSTSCEGCGSPPNANTAAFGEAKALRDRVIAIYGGASIEAAVQFSSDLHMVEPAITLARLHAANGQKTWVYNFDYRTKATAAKFRGPPHFAEVPYVFGRLRDPKSAEYGIEWFEPAPEDLRASDDVITYWTNFAKTSVPRAAGRPAWRAFTKANGMALTFSEGGPVLEPHFREARVDIVTELANAK
ncbi:carboxylesterase family protein [Sphingobium sp. H39-3-25]|uniref:carboxylesterase/lipase family protein n=1 Tax=Sphingobium arseniciresistens TaxID=3030834 RepID=UPI0023BA1013|nr:carboxylesterase family protein [Sphingobium arseniciresistens]